jgi:hypothetical protein
MQQPQLVRAGVPLLVTVFSAVLPVIFIIGWALGSQDTGKTSLAPDSASAWISALATLAIAILTFILAKETWYLREVQVQQLAELKRENIRPNVSVQLDPNRVGMNFIDVKVSNLGKGIARKITVAFLDRQGNPIPAGSDPVVEKFRKLAMFRQGIESMGIGQVISSFVFSFFDLGKELKGDIFAPVLSMVIRFEDVEGTQYKNEFVVDFAQYEGLSELGGGDPLHLLSQEVKKLREIFDTVKQSDGRMAVAIYDADDRRAETERNLERLERSRREATK